MTTEMVVIKKGGSWASLSCLFLDVSVYFTSS